MKLKLLLLLLVFFCTFILPAQLSKHDHHPKHDKKDHKEKPGERHGNKHGKRRGRVENLLADYDDDSSDDDDEERGQWLFQLQGVRGSCTPNPCLNNGLCEENRGRFKCKCPKPFKGRVCEKSKKACKADTCGYGQCVLTSTPPYFACKCKAPFQPPDCKKIAPCQLNLCLNGGTCEKDGQDFDCVCKTGFSGKFCQVGPNDCYKGNGESYRGMVSETENGDDCLFWNSYFLLGKGTNPFNTFNDPQGLGPHNYCRNPDGESKPWCFVRTGRKIRWDHCDVRKCPTDDTPTAHPEPKPTTAHSAVIHPAIKPTPPGTSESPIPGSDTDGNPIPASDATGTPIPVSDTTGTPFPVSEAAGTPFPVSEAAGTPFPVSEAAGTPFPVSEAAGKPFLVSEDAGSSTPGSDTEILTPGVPAAPTIRPVERQFAICGKPQPKRPINRIYGGIKALPGGQPWQASVQLRPKATVLPFKHVCGGTLIKPCWVLTAGHCIDKTKDYRVVLGTINLAKNEPTQQTLEVVEAIIHERYKETTESVHNDIALLRLKDRNGKCAEESQFVKTACLPSEDFPDGTVCSISGWGATSESLYGSNQLLDADVLLISQETCSSAKVYGNIIDNSMVCAGHLEGGVDSCQGDSGGPLTCVGNQIHYIYGIVSWGDNCGLKNKPGVYTRVKNFVDWINRTTARAGV
ncbi:hyaluronan-binding protein 2 [Ictalurus furcatus]|uniref:hyaluronan-binding protein 2 n=1 Tax=Ictalurus furcatus TaxID=66913 RepID=UPI002350F376|nr:hyaluronan-binding protein 2 [Ictalurus furcatus]